MRFTTSRWRAAYRGLHFVLASLALWQFTFFGPVMPSARADDDRDRRTETPIKHVIIIVGENRSFDHLFATYEPMRKQERVRNLLSEGIVRADGSPGPNFKKAHQFKVVSAPNGGKFFSSADMASKELYSTLPPPDVNGLQARNANPR